MTRAARFTQADVTRLIKGAMKAGLPVGTFKVVVEDGCPTLLPASAPERLTSSDQEEDAWQGAMAAWRHSG